MFISFNIIRKLSIVFMVSSGITRSSSIINILSRNAIGIHILRISIKNNSFD